MHRMAVLFAALGLAIVAPPAGAAPADLDTSWGTKGLATVAGDRFRAEGAPHLLAGGKVLATGRQRSEDRTFLARLDASGATDPTFDITTNVPTAVGRGISALAPDNRVVVAGGGDCTGPIVLERYNLADGSIDPSFGVGGRLTVNLQNYCGVPTAMVVQPDGKMLMTISTNSSSGGANFTIVRMTATGLDGTFGQNGIARVNAVGQSVAHDVALLSNGSIVVAGSYKEGTVESNTAVARLKPNGAKDTGLRTFDLSGNNTADHATSVVVDSAGRIIVAGPVGSEGIVARFTSAVALDGSFGSDGRRLVSAPGTGGRYAPADIAMDPTGRLILGGTSQYGFTSPLTSRWTVSRLTANGGLDDEFSGGSRLISECENTTGWGVTGVAATTAHVYVQGSCGDTGNVVVARLFQDNALRSALKLMVDTPSEAAGYRLIKFAKLDPTAALGNTNLLTGQSVRNAPLTRSPLTRSPLTRSPLTRSPLTRSPLTRSPLTRSPLTRSPLTRSPIGPVLLSSIPLTRSSWEDVLKPYGIDVPWQTLTLDDVINQAPQALESITLADIPLTRSPLANVSYAAFLFGWTALDKLPVPEGFTDWCKFLEGKAVRCNSEQGAENLSLLDLEIGGVDLTPYYSKPISLKAVQFGTGAREAVLSQAPINTIATAQTPFGKVPAIEVWKLMTGCTATDCPGTIAERQATAEQAGNPDGFSTASLGELIAKLSLPSLPDVTFGQLLTGLLPVYDIPYERTPLPSVLSQAEIRSTDLVTYSATVTVDCGQTGSDLRTEVKLPEGARYIKDSAKVSGAPSPNPSGTGENLSFNISSGCSGSTTVKTLTLTFAVEPGYELGPVEASGQVLNGIESAAAKVASHVDDSDDTPDAAAGAQSIDVEQFVTGHISGAEDIDAYRFQLPEAGSIVQVTLRVPKQSDRDESEKADPPADFDLYLHIPEAGLDSTPLTRSPLTRSPLTRSPLTRSPLTRSDVPDSSQEPGLTEGVLAPDGLQDIPLTRSLLSQTPLTRSSINRGGEPESASIQVSQTEAGRNAYIRVAGYNGSYSRYPYVLRVRAIPGPPPPACQSRNLQANGTAGAWPESIAAGTESIILFNQRRFSARFPGKAAEVRQRLEAFAARPEVNGVVISPESHPDAGSNSDLDVDGAARAWDEDSCSPAAANLVVQRTANVIDSIMVDADGKRRLNDLKHLMVVGTDDIAPFMRIRDNAVLANESEYADDAVFGDTENAVSGSLRRGYILSDDPIADFDPQPRAGGDFYVPDLAVGRVVETPDEILLQLTRFETSNGVLDPKTANVFGYDFLSDGSREVADALTRITTAFTRIDEDWDAAAALARMNGSDAQIGSYNAHYDHYRAQPAAEFHGRSTALIHANQVSPNRSSLFFNMGCHGGLSIPDIVVAVPTGDEGERLGDWPQSLQTLYAANTGYGYGDTDVVAYSERLSAIFAQNLATRQMSAAQAAMYAKQSFSGSLGIGDDYDAKAMNQFTFYGPPMYRLQNGSQPGTIARPALPETPSLADPGPTSAQTLTRSFTLRRKDGDRGTFWVSVKDGLEEDPLVVQHRPIQPRTQIDVTQEGGAPAHGFILDDIVTDQHDGINPAYGLPTIDFAANEPEQEGQGTVFPATTQSVQSVQTPQGRRDVLDLVLGQYRDDEGSKSQILITSLKGRVLRSYSSDYEPPVIDRVRADLVQGGVVFNVDTTDDATGGTILFRTDKDTNWRKVELAKVTDGRLAAASALPEGTTKVFDGTVQIIDAAGNVGVGKNKVVGHFARIGQNFGTTPRFAFSPAPPPSGYYEVAPTITLETGDRTATFEFSIDGGPYVPYTEPFTIPQPQEGTHILRARGSDGSETAAVIAVDALAPTVTGFPRTSPNENGWYNGDVVVDFFCADAASGVKSCSPASTTITGEGANLSASATAEDFANHTATGTVSGIKIDRTAPTITGSADRAPEYGSSPKRWWKGKVTVKFTCTDSLSGIEFCPFTSGKEFGEGEGQELKGTATDRAFNQSDGVFGDINVDATAPAPPVIQARALYTPFDVLTGSATDDHSGVALVKVFYEPVGNVPPGRQPHTKDASLASPCGPNNSNRSCSWSAELPDGLGQWRATAVTTDRVTFESQASTPEFFSIGTD